MFEKLSLNKRKMWIFFFSGFASFFLKYKTIFKVGARQFHFQKYKKNVRLESSISANMKKFLILELKSSISENIRNFLILELENFIC